MTDTGTVLVTGAAGFIGFHTAKALLDQGRTVVGLDNHSDYYDPALKEARVAQLAQHTGYIHLRADLAEADAVLEVLAGHQPRLIIHLAAQAGVRYGAENPQAYVDSNITGFMNLMEAARVHRPDHIVFASTSSIYGANTAMPFSETHGTAHPVSFYAATKKANEMMAHTYAHLYDLPLTGLRFFTVYGPWGRPDMAPHKFVKAIFAGEAIDVYNHGQLARDFTYIDDIVEGVLRISQVIPQADPNWDARSPDPDRSGVAPYQIYNIGRGEPVELEDFIAAIESATGQKAARNMMEMQPGDVHKTWCDISALEAATGYRPTTDLQTGIEAFVAWFRDYYGV